MQEISIKATDTLFFRDGRPFSMGDDNFAQGVFPPHPSVIYGALRTEFISKHLKDDQSLEGLIKESEKLKICFLAYKTDGNVYFPMPKDLIVPQSKYLKELKTEMLSIEEAPKLSSCTTQKVLKSKSNSKTESDFHLMDLIAFEKYLSGNGNNLIVKKLNDFITYEPKIGIGRNKDSNTVDGGKLFRTQSHRLAIDTATGIHDLQLLIKTGNLGFPTPSYITLGGDRKIAFYSSSKVPKIELPEINSNQFKIYLATPGIFATGWKPEELLKKYDLTLITAAIERPIHIGGWDMKINKPKVMVQAVGSGAVYYVQAQSTEEAKEVANLIHGKSITENLNGIDYQAQGFGICFIGKVN